MIHTLNNGQRNLSLHFSLVSTGADLTNYELLDVSDYDVEGHIPAGSYEVKKVEGRNGTGTSFQLKFGSSVGNHVQFFESYPEGDFCFEPHSLVPKNPDANLKILMDTSGYDSAGDSIDFTLHLKKRYVR